MAHPRAKPGLTLSSTPQMAPQASISIDNDNGRISAVLPTGDSIEVLLFGATVVSWKDKAGRELLWLSESADLTGKKAVRGGIPLVFPVFGTSPDHASTASLPQHGFARTSRWEFLGKSTTESSDKGSGDTDVKLDFGLGPENLSAEAKAKWGYNFAVIYSVTLGQSSLRTSILVRNEGQESWDFQTLMHTYLRVPDIHTTSVSGLSSTTYIDKVASVTTTSTSGPLTFSGETDRIYTPSSLETPITVSSGQKPIFELVRDNLENVVVWNPWIEKSKGMADFAPKDGYKQMLCVEAGTVGQWVKLEGGEAWEGGVVVKSLL